MIEGLDNCLVKFAKCCSPVPGDPVVGFITRGYGVSVHRQDCSNYLQQGKSSTDSGRWVRASWSNTENRTYSTGINIVMHSRKGLVIDIASVFNSLGINMSAFNARESAGNQAFISLEVDVRNRDELITAMARLMSVQGVTDVMRTDG